MAPLPHPYHHYDGQDMRVVMKEGNYSLLSRWHKNDDDELAVVRRDPQPGKLIAVSDEVLADKRAAKLHAAGVSIHEYWKEMNYIYKKFVAAYTHFGSATIFHYWIHTHESFQLPVSCRRTSNGAMETTETRTGPTTTWPNHDLLLSAIRKDINHSSDFIGSLDNDVMPAPVSQRFLASKQYSKLFCATGLSTLKAAGRLLRAFPDRFPKHSAVADGVTDPDELQKLGCYAEYSIEDWNRALTVVRFYYLERAKTTASMNLSSDEDENASLPDLKWVDIEGYDFLAAQGNQNQSATAATAQQRAEVINPPSQTCPVLTCKPPRRPKQPPWNNKLRPPRLASQVRPALCQPSRRTRRPLKEHKTRSQTPVSQTRPVTHQPSRRTRPPPIKQEPESVDSSELYSLAPGWKDMIENETTPIKNEPGTEYCHRPVPQQEAANLGLLLGGSSEFARPQVGMAWGQQLIAEGRDLRDDMASVTSVCNESTYSGRERSEHEMSPSPSKSPDTRRPRLD